VIVTALWALLVLPVILSGRGSSQQTHDERVYHGPVIARMMDEWPRMDLVDYDSATAPGYHVVMATVAHVTGTPARGLLVHLVNAGASLALLLGFLFFTQSLTSPRTAVVLALPLLLSSQYLDMSIWLFTDNAALLFVVIGMGLTLTGVVNDRLAPSRTAWSGATALAAVAIRQIHLWMIAPIVVASLLDRRRSPGARIGLAMAGAMGPVILVGLMVWQWGGLTPPGFEPPYAGQHDGGANLATPAFALSLCGGFGVLLLGVGQVRPRFDACAWGAMLLGVLLALAVPTSYHLPDRYGGWLWAVVKWFPAPGERSLVLLAGAPLGALVITWMIRAALDAGRRDAVLVLGTAALGYLAAHTVNTQCFQRYLEPATLIWLAWLVLLVPRRPRWWWTGPALLCAGQALVTGVTLYRDVLAAAD
jgi:hypothetical protein